ncbi:MAG: ADP-ribosylation/crystallin J1 [Chloroflexi bacterium]|nr:ADP-ribosylation/crystallin J1 [Chloroflexota bacterium]
MILYRPVGLNELKLIAQSGYKAFPPRLPEQPIFYPVLNLEYAEQIAQNWNATRPPFAGFVTYFEVDDEYLARFPIQTVGAHIHQELWVPAKELEEFNEHIRGKIQIVRSFYGKTFDDAIDVVTQLPKSVIDAECAD